MSLLDDLANWGKSLVRQPAQGINTIAGGVPVAFHGVQAAANDLFGNKQGAAQARKQQLDATRQLMRPNSGLFGVGSAFNPVDVNQRIQQAQNAQKQWSDVGKWTDENLVRPIQQDIGKAYNTVAAPITGLTGSAMAQSDRIFNGGKNYDALIAATKTQMDKQLAESFVAPETASGKANPVEFTGNFAGTGARLAPYAVGFGSGGLPGQFGKTVAGNVANKALQPIVQRAATQGANAAIAAPAFAGINAVQQVGETGQFDPGQAIAVGALSGAMTLGGGLVGDATMAGFRKTANGWEKGANAMVRENPNIPANRMKEAGFAKAVSINEGPIKQVEARIRKLNPDLAIDTLTDAQKRIALANIEQQAGRTIADTGQKMFGSKKDLVKLKNITVNNIGEIENAGDRVAASLVNKARVLGDDAKYVVNRAGDPALENYRKLAISAIPSKPAQNAAARAWYVQHMPEYVQRVKNATSIEEMQMAGRQLANAASQEVENSWKPGTFTTRNNAKQWLGSRSYNMIQGYAKNMRDAAYRPPKDFSFDTKAAGVQRRAGTSDGIELHGGTPEEYVRQGAPELANKDPKSMVNDFGFKGLEYGNYVKDGEAAAHMARFGDSMMDMEQLLGMDFSALNKQMDLGVGFGSRGGSKALAHYEPSNKVINITKKNTVDGSLAHEYMHAIDDFLAGAASKNGKYASSGISATPEIRNTMRELMTALKQGDGTYRRPISKKGWDMAYEGKETVPKAWSQIDRYLERAGNDPQAAMDMIVTTFRGNKPKMNDKIARYLMEKTGVEELDMPTGESKFYSQAKSRGDYWARDTEMLARAFDAYMGGKIRAAGINNNYVAKSQNMGGFYHPENMEQIAPLFEKLFGEIKKVYNIPDAPQRATAAAAESLDDIAAARAPTEAVDDLRGQVPADADVMAQVRAKMQQDGINGNEAAKALGVEKAYEQQIKSEMAQAYREADGPLMPAAKKPAPKKKQAETLDQIAQRAPTEAVDDLQGKVPDDVPVPASHADEAGFAAIPGKAEKKPPTPPAETAPAAPAAPDKKLSRFANKTVPNSDEVSKPLQKMVKEEKIGYDPTTNEGRIQAAKTELADMDNTQAATHVLQKLENSKFDTKGQDVVTAIEAAKRLDEAGDETSLMQATEIYGQLSERLSKAGQEVQAASLLSNRTPQGLIYQAEKTLRKGGVDVTPALKKEVQKLVDVVKKSEKSSYEDGLARFKLMEFVEKKLPYKGGTKAVQIWKAGLLTAPTTTGGNMIGNSSEQIFKRGYKDPVANGVDILFSAFTGKRSRSLTYRGLGGGFKEGIGKGVSYFKTGYDPRNPAAKFDAKNVHYSDTPLGRAAEKYTQAVFRLMGGQDQPFYYASLRNSIADQAITAAKNAKLKGTARDDFIRKFITEPTKDVMELADNEARYDVFQNETALGNAARGFKRETGAVGDFIIPFSQVPSSIATRMIERTPIGLAHEILRQAKSKKFNQRAMTRAVADSSAGLVLLGAGAALAKEGQITLGFPQDQKERDLWELEGKQPNSVRIGDRWYSLNYIQPIGTLLAAGANYQNALKDGKNQTDAVNEALAGAGKALSEQSFLKGVSGILNAVNDPKRFAATTYENTAGSIVPNFIRSFARSTDEVNREQDGALESIQAGIPGLRQGLPVRKDILGQDVPRKTGPGIPGAIDSYLNPFKPSNVRETTPLINELRRLQNAGEGITASQLTKDSLGKDINGNPIELDKKQTTKLEDQIGPDLKAAWEQTVSDPEYQALSDGDKKRALDKVKDQVNEQAKDTFTSGMGVERAASAGSVKINPTVSGDSKQILKSFSLMGEAKKNKYFESNNDAEYKYKLAKYENDKANGTLSKAEDAKTRVDLQKEKVGSSYSKETRDLYGLSKNVLFPLLQSDPNGQAIAEQVVALGDALEAAGLGKNKFRDSKGNISLAPSSGGRGRGSGIASFASAISATASGSKAAANAKVRSIGGGFQNKVGSGRTIQAYKKPTATKVGGA